jgi:cytidylate kinase
MELIFLHGKAAAGKLTVARELGDRLHYPVFHNHLVINILTELFPFGSEPFVRLREQIWLSVFAEAANADTSLIFTFAPELTVQLGFPLRVREVVEGPGGRVHFVRLLVSEVEQERRINSPTRREWHKLSDVATLKRQRERNETPEQPAADLTIDTELLSVDQAADSIIRTFHLDARTPIVKFPDAT